MDVRANGINFNVVIEGPEGAPWMTFSNSHATDLTVWDRQAALMAENFRVLRYDTRGHGKTDVTEPPYSIDMLVDDVIALWAELGVDTSHFVGLSLGGSTAIGIAIEYPGRINRLLATDCRAWTPNPAAWAERIRVVEEGGMEAAIPKTVERWFTADYREKNPPEYQKVVNMIRTTPLDGYIGGALALKGIDYKDRLGTINCPCQFLCGESDSGATPESVWEIASLVPGAKFDIIPDAAHIVNVQNPDVFETYLTEFFDA
jgi:3-oxoadipate enol-lactonase